MPVRLVADANAFTTNALVEFVKTVRDAEYAARPVPVADLDSPGHAEGFHRDRPIGTPSWPHFAAANDGSYHLPYTVRITFPRNHAVVDRRLPRIGDANPRVGRTILIGLRLQVGDGHCARRRTARAEQERG